MRRFSNKKIWEGSWAPQQLGDEIDLRTREHRSGSIHAFTMP
jgi:hypothetical protein